MSTNYTEQTWADNDVTKPVSAARMTHIEAGIAAVDTAAAAAVAAEATARAAAIAAAVSSLDDVLAFGNLAAFPATGTVNTVYIADDTNFLYRWSGSAYAQVGGGSISKAAVIATGLAASDIGADASGAASAAQSAAISAAAPRSSLWVASTAVKAGQILTNAGTAYTVNADFTTPSTFSTTGLTAIASGGGSSPLIGLLSYEPGTRTQPATSSGTLVDVDASNLAVTFAAPASGRILVRLSSCLKTSSSNGAFWGLTEGATIKANQYMGVTPAGVVVRVGASMVVTGLSAGSHTFKWAFAAEGGAAVNLDYGGSYPIGAAVMEVWAA